MKNLYLRLGLTGLFLLVYGCSKSPEFSTVVMQEGEGLLVIRTNIQNDAVTATKGSNITLPIPPQMTLEIYPDGENEPHHKIDDLDETRELGLRAGNYRLIAYSDVQTEPRFDAPVYAGERAVSIRAGSTTRTDMSCTLANAGVRFEFSDDFKAGYESYRAEVVQHGFTLSYEENDLTRIGFFEPGTVDIYVYADGVTMERRGEIIESRSIYTISVTQAMAPDGSFDLGLTIDNDYNGQEREIEFEFKGETILFQETVGTTKITNLIAASSYTEYLCDGILYSDSAVNVQYNDAYSSSGYTNASGGNHWVFYSGGYMMLTGIDISGATDLILNIGVYNPDDKTFSHKDLAISYSVDGINEKKLNYEFPITSVSENWVCVEIPFPELNNANELSLRFSSTKSYLLLDDLIISGVK